MIVKILMWFQFIYNIFTDVNNSIDTKVWYLLKRGTTWNDLQRPTRSKKQPETTYSDLQGARNNLKRPTTSKKRPETTYNDLKRPITTKKRPGNDLQRARNDLKQPTTSKTQPTTSWTYLQRAKKKTQNDQQQADFEIILQYAAIGSLL